MRKFAAIVSLVVLMAGAALAGAPGPTAPTSTGPSAPPVAPAPVISAPVSTAPVSMPPPKGTLVGVSVGMPCTWTLNGQMKGTNSSIRIDLRPGAYTVTCKSAVKSQSKAVMIRSGETAMAMFKHD